MKKVFAALSLTLFLGACASSMQPDPIGIGRGVNDLKQSPCACIEIPMNHERLSETVRTS